MLLTTACAAKIKSSNNYHYKNEVQIVVKCRLVISEYLLLDQATDCYIAPLEEYCFIVGAHDNCSMPFPPMSLLWSFSLRIEQFSSKQFKQAQIHLRSTWLTASYPFCFAHQILLILSFL